MKKGLIIVLIASAFLLGAADCGKGKPEPSPSSKCCTDPQIGRQPKPTGTP